MRISLLALLISLFIGKAQAQILTMSPAVATPNDAVTLTFDASLGNQQLLGASDVYLHHGVVTANPTSTNWQYVIGNWGQDDGIGQMTPVAGEPNKWQITFQPSIREYFNVPDGTNIFRISAVVRSADGTIKATMPAGAYPWGNVTSSGDIFINLNVTNYLTFGSPTNTESFFLPGNSLSIQATASAPASNLQVQLDQGTGFQTVTSLPSGTSITYNYTPTQSVNLGIRVLATINGETVTIQKSHHLVVVQPSVVAALPPNIRKGINYDQTDPTRATLVLEAPGKDYVHVVGDFNDWTASDDYQMKVTPDGELFWLEINNLTPQQAYVFQYWVEGSIKIGDPYATQVADPWNDGFIEPTVFPNIPAFTNTSLGMATVLQTNQEEYQWSAHEATWQRPPVDHLVIYELHIRDFLASHSYADLIDTLDYLKNIGIDAIELMPVTEFEGNDSWGYNPAYYFASDKYYGTRNELKRFIDSAHVKGLPVILDLVLNHAYGQNPMVKLYFNQAANKPAADNPWFNVDVVGPYSWGYDFNHESPYTQAFVDSVNHYWLREFHCDGYRFDFTKGFTNYAPGGNIDGFDQSRIDILTRMADKIREVDPQAYIILEHWGGATEEQVLANEGMVMWKNRSYDYVPAATGNNTGSFGGMNVTSHVTYFNSHDEQRIAYHTLNEGLVSEAYSARNPLVMLERMKMTAAFAFLFPGPKMMWQFDELGYDIDINFNGRVGRKPLPWGQGSLQYYEDPLRKNVRSAYAGILDVRKQIGAENLSSASTNHQLTGNTRRLVYNTNNIDLVLVGNFSIQPQTINPAFTQTGMWYDYFSGDSLLVSDVNQTLPLVPGQWHIFTTTRLGNGMPGVVEIFENPVTITPYPFTQFDEITVRFDATKAWNNGTSGLVDADSVYFHSGVVTAHPDSTTWNSTVGSLLPDNLGLMTEVSPDIWEITLTPAQYYSLAENVEAFRLGMYFRDAQNQNFGYGFQNDLVWYEIESPLPFLTVVPPAFQANEPITVTFNTRRGNRELMDATKVYMHSSVGIVDTQTPQTSAWNNTTGNWGADDGIGRMTAVANQPGLWQITLTPSTYYELTDGAHPYWLAAVFRSADGSIKGTGTPGEIENGFIAPNLDFFIKNQLAIYIDPTELNPRITLYPNPASSHLQINGLNSEASLQIHNLLGQTVLDCKVNGEQSVDISHLSPGLYTYTFIQNGSINSGKWIKQ